MTFSTAYAKAQTQAYVTGNTELEELLGVALREHCKLVGEIAGLKFQLETAQKDLAEKQG